MNSTDNFKEQFISKFGNNFKLDDVYIETQQDTLALYCNKHSVKCPPKRACKLLEIRTSPCPECDIEVRNERLERKNIAKYNKLAPSSIKYTRIIGNHRLLGKSSEKTVYGRCEFHGSIKISYRSIQNGFYCSQCKKEHDLKARKTLFLKNAKLKHGNYYDYSLVDYKEGGESIVIICPIHGEFEQPPSSHVSGRGCKECGKIKSEKNRIATLIDKSKTLGEYPEILEEWDFTLNPMKAAPAELKVSGSHKKFYWKCPAGVHESYKARIYDRVATGRGYSCPKCTQNQSSKAELYLKAMLELFVNKVAWRSVIKNNEVDFYLPDYQIAIELDGYPWHDQRRLKKDIEKTKVVSSAGMRLIRIRDTRNPPIEGEVFDLKNTDYYDSNRYLVIVSKIIQFCVLNNERVIKEHKKTVTRLLANFSVPPDDRSLLYTCPDIEVYWSECNDIDIRFIWKGENKKYKFFCQKCGIKFPRSPKEISREWVRKGSMCKACSKERQGDSYRENMIASRGSFAEKHPNLIPFWSANNKISPEDITSNANVLIEWICPKKLHENTKMRVYDYIKSKHRCDGCYKKSLSEKNPNGKTVTVINQKNNKKSIFTQQKDAASFIGQSANAFATMKKRNKNRNKIEYKNFIIIF